MAEVKSKVYYFMIYESSEYLTYYKVKYINEKVKQIKFTKPLKKLNLVSQHK